MRKLFLTYLFMACAPFSNLPILLEPPMGRLIEKKPETHVEIAIGGPLALGDG
jgi:hypothetical protein